MLYKPNIEEVKSRFKTLLNYNLEKGVENLKHSINSNPAVNKTNISLTIGVSFISLNGLLSDSLSEDRINKIILLFRVCSSININPFDLEKEPQDIKPENFVKLHSCFFNRYFSAKVSTAKIIYSQIFRFSDIKKQELEEHLKTVFPDFSFRYMYQMTYTDFFISAYVLGYSTNLQATLNLIKQSGLSVKELASSEIPSQSEYKSSLSPRSTHSLTVINEELEYESPAESLANEESNTLKEKILAGLLKPGQVRVLLGVPCITKYVPYEWGDKIIEVIKGTDPGLSRIVEDKDLGLSFHETLYFNRTDLWKSPIEVYLCNLTYGGERGEFIGYVSEEEDNYLIRKSLHSDDSVKVPKKDLQIKGKLALIQRDSDE